ncbi:putative ribonuclease H-like domain-containing protein [Tanacetum coccineum]
MEVVGSSNGQLVKMGKASRNKGHNVNKHTPPPQPKIEEILPLQSIAPQPVYHPLSQKQKEKVKEDLDKKLSNNEFGEEDKIRIVEHGLPKKMRDLRNFMLSNLGLSDPRPYHSNLPMADNTQFKAMGEVRNVRIQIGYQSYLVDFLLLDIPIDKELPLLLGCPFLRTCEAVIDMGRDDWLSCFEVGRDEDGNPKYGPVAPSFLDIEDEMERALEMEAYFNPFKNIIVFKILIEFLGSLSVQLKNTDWGNEGYGMYKKIEGDGAWHTKFEVITPSG